MAKKQIISNINPIESLTELPHELTRALTQDVAKESSKEFVRQLLGIEKKDKPQPVEMNPGVEISLSKAAEAPARAIEAGIDYISEVLHGSERIHKKKESDTETQVHQIQNELAQLLASTKEVQIDHQVLDMQVKEGPVEAGIYHQIQAEQTRAQIQEEALDSQDSGSWLAVAKNKVLKRDYHSLAKSQGTQFTLSSERVVATQTG